MIHNPHRRAALVLAGLVLLAGAAHARQTPPKTSGAKKPPTRIQVGEVVVEGFDAIKNEGNFKKVTLTGDDSTIIAPDRKSGATLRLQSNLIVAQNEGRVQAGRVDLLGPVKFTVTQKLPSGAERVLNGTAGKGLYRKSAQTMTLSGGVKADLTDPEMLGDTATLRARTVNVDLSKNPPVFTIEGEGSELKFAPKPRGASNAPQVDEVRASDFSEGTFQAGRVAAFRGALRSVAGKFWGDGPTLELANATDGNAAKLQAERVQADFDANGRVQSAEAERGVRAQVRRPSPVKGAKDEQAVQATAARAAYALKESLVTLTRDVRADLTAPDALAEPALLRASESVTVRVQKPYHYQAKGDADSTLFRFAPVPPPADPALAPNAGQADADKDAKPPRRFGFGQATVSGFESGVYAPGQKLVFEGGRPVFATLDRATASTARVEAGRVEADFADDRTVREARMTGNVRYAFSQTVNGARQAWEGTAVRALFVSAGDARAATLQGPFLATITAPEQLRKPGTATGQTGDTLTLDLAATPYAFEMSSPNRTGTIHFEPREADDPKDAEKKPAAPARAAPPKKAGKK